MTAASRAKHIVITGQRGAGKSTLIKRLLGAALSKGRSLAGYVTVRKVVNGDGTFVDDSDRFYRSSPVEAHHFELYIFTAEEYMALPENAGRESFDEAHLMGRFSAAERKVDTAKFVSIGAESIRNARPGDIIVMDELGFMESGSAPFSEAVTAAFGKDDLIIAAVRYECETPLLNKVRSMADDIYTVTPGNRENLFEELSALLN